MKNNFPHRVHFVGIGGIGMSGLAKHLVNVGCEVSGSDKNENEQTQRLRQAGVAVTVPHDAKCVKGAQLVVRTSAVLPTNEEVAFALSQGIPVVLREQLLGQVFDGFPTRIAVCGTHGKTTVTAMIHHVLERCGISHTAFIGGEYQHGNYFFGENVVVAEACEYNRGFLHLHPTLCLCLNAEWDHPDCYTGKADVQRAFGQFFAQSDVVLLPKNLQRLCKTAHTWEDLRARNVVVKNGCASFVLAEHGKNVFCCTLKVHGKHNVQNALATLAVAKQLGVPLLQAAQALCTFEGVDRRWTEQNCLFPVVCDYAHHPTEISAAVQTAKEVCKGRVFCVFQPHTFSRTKALFGQFLRCFCGADTVVFLPTYPAREKPCQGTTAFQLFKSAKAQGTNAKYFASFARAAQFLKKHVKATDLVLLVGAGDVNKLAELLK